MAATTTLLFFIATHLRKKPTNKLQTKLLDCLKKWKPLLKSSTPSSLALKFRSVNCLPCMIKKLLDLYATIFPCKNAPSVMPHPPWYKMMRSTISRLKTLSFWNLSWAHCTSECGHLKTYAKWASTGKCLKEHTSNMQKSRNHHWAFLPNDMELKNNGYHLFTNVVSCKLKNTHFVHFGQEKGV